MEEAFSGGEVPLDRAFEASQLARISIQDDRLLAIWPHGLAGAKRGLRQTIELRSIKMMRRQKVLRETIGNSDQNVLWGAKSGAAALDDSSDPYGL